MKLMKVFFWALLLVSSMPHAQEAKVLPDEASLAYDRTQSLPDATAFMTTMTGLAVMQRQGDSESPIESLQYGMSVSSDTASILLSQFMSTYEAALTEARSAIQTHACTSREEPAGHSRWHGEHSVRNL